MVEQWVKDVRSEARAEANLRVETNKALGFAEQKNQELTTKLIVEERAWKSVEVDLKNALDLVEDQCKKLYHTEIKLATAKQRAEGRVVKGQGIYSDSQGSGRGFEACIL